MKTINLLLNIIGFITLLLSSLCQANITLYGRVNTALEFNNIESQRTDIKQRNASSRFGLKGQETIGFDHIIEFQIENGFDSTGTSSGKLANRETFIGINNNDGHWRIGTNELPSYTLFDATVTKFHDTGNASYLQTPNQSMSALGDIGSRISNSFIYKSPSLLNFNAALLFSDAHPMIAGTSVQKIIDGNIMYQNTTFTAGFGFRTYQDSTALQHNTLFIIATKYTIPYFLDISAAYERGDYRSTARQIDKLFLSTQYNYNAFAFIASAGLAGNVHYQGQSQPNTRAHQITFGFSYTFSKRTQLYMYFSQLRNQREASYQFLDNTQRGQSNQSLTFGIRHNF
ncbi:MAG: porin [Pseudomonadota bacterium]